MKLETSDLVGYIKQRHFQQIRELKVKPTLAIAVAGAEAASASFIRAKQRYAADIGAELVIESSKDQNQLIKQLQAWASDSAITGVVVQLPLPEGFDTDAVITAIAPAKDVDGLRPDSPYEPATAKAVLWILASLGLKLAEQTICVVGQGRLVGRPVSAALEQTGVQVQRCDINTPNLSAQTKAADIVISGAGQPGLIKRAMLANDAIVIDAGTSEAAGQLAGDADPALYIDETIKVTPVPGGVGPMTVAALFDNLLIGGR